MTAGRDIRDLKPGELRLQIYTITCACGNSWTHSETWGRSLTSSHYFRHDPQMQLDGEYTHIAPFSISLQEKGCFKCIPLSLAVDIPVKWGTPAPRPLPRPEASTSPRRCAKRPLTLEDL